MKATCRWFIILVQMRLCIVLDFEIKTKHLSIHLGHISVGFFCTNIMSNNLFLNYMIRLLLLSFSVAGLQEYCKKLSMIIKNSNYFYNFRSQKT